MKIFNQIAIDRISLAYDLFKKEEFLDRLFKFMTESEALIIENERRNQTVDELCNKIIEGAKSKPGPKVKSQNGAHSFTEGAEV